jgi:hypothetical protein
MSDAISAPTKPIVVEFDYTADELVEYEVWREFHRPSARVLRRRARRRALWALIAVPLAIGALVWAWRDGLRPLARLLQWLGITANMGVPILLGVALTGLGVIGLGVLWLLRAAVVLTAPGETRFKRMIRTRYAKSAPPEWTGQIEMLFSPEGVAVSHGGEPGFSAWAALSAFHETPTLLVFVDRELEDGFMPKRALGDGSEGPRRLRQILQWAAAKGGGQEATLYPVLAAHDALCPECRYNLRGVRSAVRPECGVAIAGHLLRLPRESGRK